MTTTPTPDLDPDAVRLVEDTIDATSERWSCGAYGCDTRFTTDRTAPAILAALLEAGWQPPAPVTHTSIHVRTEHVIEQRAEHRWVRTITLDLESDARTILTQYRSIHPNTTFRLVREHITHTPEHITHTRTHIDPPLP